MTPDEAARNFTDEIVSGFVESSVYWIVSTVYPLIAPSPAPAVEADTVLLAVRPSAAAATMLTDATAAAILIFNAPLLRMCSYPSLPRGALLAVRDRGR